MEPTEFATQLLAATPEERQRLLMQHRSQVDVALARALKTCYDQFKFHDPTRAAASAQTLQLLMTLSDQPEIWALADWTIGMAALHIDSQAKRALTHFDLAITQFALLQQPTQAANVQISRLHALALQGRYDEAVNDGEQARQVLLQHGDLVGAGKIEQNLGGIYWRRGQYRQVEAINRQAYARYQAVGDQAQMAQLESVLGGVLALQHQFAEATQLYQQGLLRAEAGGWEITQAEIECNIGTLALRQGRYDQALDYMERARRKYAKLQKPYEAGISEQGLAEAYLELNMASEAAAIYQRLLPVFAELQMAAEQAETLLLYARTCCLLGQTTQAHQLLDEASRLFISEDNPVGQAMTWLVNAQVYFDEQNFGAADEGARLAVPILQEAGLSGWVLQAQWLRAEVARQAGKWHDAHQILITTLHSAEQQMLPHLMQRCHTSLGLLAMAQGDSAAAETAFQQAVTLIEEMRAPLPAEEFRLAFVADKLTPYNELVRLCLADGTPARITQALAYVERARTRTLLDMIAGTVPTQPAPRDAFERELTERLETLRAELNWFYSQINRPNGEAATRGEEMTETLYDEARQREFAIQELTRQLQQHAPAALVTTDRSLEPFDLAQLQRDLASDTVLVEYFSMDEQLLAFVVTNQQVHVVQLAVHEDEVTSALQQMQFQLGTLRLGANQFDPYIEVLTTRTRDHLALLYDLLLRPLEAYIGDHRLLVSPYRMLHYVPFAALYDGERYVIEGREVCCTPSVGLLHHCLRVERHPLQRATLLGAPDVYAPQVYDEITRLAPLFAESVTLLGEDCTQANLQLHAPSADLLHLACHGHFRADNPFFSTLHLADGWLTVRDVYKLNLRCNLVTLSACETGVNALVPGNELIGLARAFFAAGAPAMLVSLWAVDDAATTQLMTLFYEQLLTGSTPAAALRAAQCSLMSTHPHPFFWAAFILLGRWS